MAWMALQAGMIDFFDQRLLLQEGENAVRVLLMGAQSGSQGAQAARERGRGEAEGHSSLSDATLEGTHTKNMHPLSLRWACASRQSPKPTANAETPARSTCLKAG